MDYNLSPLSTMSDFVDFDIYDGTNADEIKEFCAEHHVSEIDVLRLPAGSVIFVYEDEQGRKNAVAITDIPAQFLNIAMKIKFDELPDFNRETSPWSRAGVLEAAKRCVCGQRSHDYGEPENNFAMIARLWSEYLGVKISELDVTSMMALLKIARIKAGGTLDCFIDLAGYAACGAELWQKNN